MLILQNSTVAFLYRNSCSIRKTFDSHEVSFPMRSQLSRLGIPATTHVTNVGFFTGMSSRVTLKSPGIPERFTANRANVISDTQMSLFVG